MSQKLKKGNQHINFHCVFNAYFSALKAFHLVGSYPSLNLYLDVCTLQEHTY